jgi:hypothetical protein
MSVSASEMEAYARDCVRLAYLGNDVEIRRRLIEMARDWMAVALRKNNLAEVKTELPARQWAR